MPVRLEGSLSRAISCRAIATTTTVLLIATLGLFWVLRVHGIRVQFGPVALAAGAYGLDPPWPTPIVETSVQSNSYGRSGGSIAYLRIAGAGWFLEWSRP